MLLIPLLVFFSIFSLTFSRLNLIKTNNPTQNTENRLAEQVLQAQCTPTTCPSGQYLNYSTCLCEVCQPRNCGGAMYLDMTDCVCKCPSYPTCTENEYFDTWDCLCKSINPTTATSCTEPSDGCGVNHYWDSASCSCKCASYVACPTNYYWDTYSCSCLSSTSTTTDTTTTSTNCEPQYCGVNHYWDEVSCSCKCASYVACPTNYYWDTTICNCVSSDTNTTSETTDTASSGENSTTDTTCYPPSEGCATNYYWDGVSCMCKPDDTYTIGGSECYPPASGCNTGYYWDYDYCTCKYDSSITTSSCSPPSIGCGSGYYWDYNSCSYIYSQTMLDRLAYEPPEIITCIKSKLGDYEYQRLRYFIPTTQQGQDEIQNLKNKIADCWKVAASQQESTPFDKEQCLISSIGNIAYREIYEGRRTPTQNEYLWFQKCHGAVQKNIISLLSVNEKLPTETVACLKKTLGSNLYQQVYSGQAEIPRNLKRNVEICFGAKPQPFEQGTSYQTPQVVKDCLYNTVGEAKYNDVVSGKTQPSQEEKEKVQQCFANLNKDQQKFLPPPPEQVPFFDEDEGIKFEKADQEKKQVKKKVYGGKLTLSGKAQPNTIITIYIYSDPIVVTTKTDENGDWVYEMQKPLDEGKHVAYALVKSGNENYVRSSVINFDVLAADEEPTPQVFMEEEKASDTQKRFIYYSVGVVILITLIVTGGIYFFYTRKKLKEIEDSSLDGNSKTKSGTGPVN